MNDFFTMGSDPIVFDFFPLLVQPATGECYASPLPSYQHFSAMG